MHLRAFGVFFSLTAPLSVLFVTASVPWFWSDPADIARREKRSGECFTQKRCLLKKNRFRQIYT